MAGTALSRRYAAAGVTDYCMGVLPFQPPPHVSPFHSHDDEPGQVMLTAMEKMPVRARQLPRVAGDDMIPIEIEVDGVVVARDAVEDKAWEGICESAAFRDRREVVFIATRGNGQIIGQLGVVLQPGDDPGDDPDPPAAWSDPDLGPSAKNVVVIAHTVFPDDQDGPLHKIALRMFGHALAGEGTNPELEAVERLLEGL